MEKKDININIKVSADERKQLRILAAKANLSVSKFIRKLISDYDEQQQLKEQKMIEYNESGEVKSS